MHNSQIRLPVPVFTVVPHPDHFQVMLPEFTGIKGRLSQTQHPKYCITVSVIHPPDSSMATPPPNTAVILTECSLLLMCRLVIMENIYVKLLAQQ